MANGEAVKGNENVIKGGREESKRDANTLNCGDETLKGYEDVLKLDGEMLKGDGKAFMCERLF